MDEKKKPLLIKVAPVLWLNSSRDKRELTVAREVGYDVIVMCKGDYGDCFKRTTIDGFNADLFETHPKNGHKCLRTLNNILILFKWAHYLRRYNADVLSGRNLAGLFISWLSTIGLESSKKPLLIYDSHEMHTVWKAGQSKLHQRMLELLEGFLVRRCSFTIIPNNAGADLLMKLYNLKQRPLVIRSTPQYWTIEKSRVTETRKEILANANLPDDVFLLVYHGIVVPGRGIETALNAVSQTQGTAILILGDGDPKYIEKLKSVAMKADICERTIFHDAVPIEQLGYFLAASDCGLITIPAISPSYYYMLPNKFFENIQSMNPVIASDFPEIGSVIRRYDIGLLVDPTNISDISKAIISMKSDTSMYNRFKHNLMTAKSDLCWENESAELRKAYSRIIEDKRVQEAE